MINCILLVIPIGIPTKKAKAEMEAHSVTVEAKISKSLIENPTNLLVLFTYWFILVYFLNEIMSCFTSCRKKEGAANSLKL